MCLKLIDKSRAKNLISKILFHSFLNRTISEKEVASALLIMISETSVYSKTQSSLKKVYFLFNALRSLRLCEKLLIANYVRKFIFLSVLFF